MKLILNYSILLLMWLIPMVSACQESNRAESTTLILVRHAEKAAQPADDPPLTETGQARARMLRDMLMQGGVTAIYSTPYTRNRQTVAPLSEALDMEVIEYDPRKGVFEFLENVLQEHPGETVVICGHSNTIPVMLNILSGTENYAQLDENEYEDFFIAWVENPGHAHIINLNYPVIAGIQTD